MAIVANGNMIDNYINSYVGTSPYGGYDEYADFLRKCFLSECTNKYDSSHPNPMWNYQTCADKWSQDFENWYNTCCSPSSRCSEAWVAQNSDVLNSVTSDLQANADAASTAETSAINDAIQARQTAINAGMGKARAGLLGDSASNTNTTCAYQNAYQSSIQNQGSTQADYLNKMGQVCALCNCACNMNKAAGLNAIGAMFTGAGSGASLGASLSSGK